MMRHEKGSLLSKMSFQLIFLINLFVFAIPAMADEITIVADKWAPYCGKPNSTHPGYGIEITKHVFEKAGHTVLYKIVPWSRAIMDTRAGKFNAIIGAFKKEAPDFVFPEEEFGMTKNTFFAASGSTWRYKGLKSLQTMEIGVIKGYSYGEELDTYLKENTQQVQYVHGEDPLLKNIRKLLAGRFDVLIEDENVLLQKVKEMGVADKVVNVGGTGVSGKVYIAFSPIISNSKQYAEIFTKGIRKLKDSGKLQLILAKYGLTYWK